MTRMETDKTPMPSEMGEEDGELYPEKSRSLDCLREMRLVALLRDMIDANSVEWAAQTLDVSYRTVARTAQSGRLTARMDAELERHLLLGGGSAAAQQRERMKALEEVVRALGEQINALDEGLKNGLEELRRVVEKEVAGPSQEIRRLERRLASLEGHREELSTPETVSVENERPSPKPRWRLHRELVTQEAEPGEEQVYGEATPVIVRWRRARAEYAEALKTGTALVKAEAQARVLELEIAIIRDHELTLPPATYPWSRAERREQVWRRERSLEEARVARNRALLRRWLRRTLTFRLWRD